MSELFGSVLAMAHAHMHSNLAEPEGVVECRKSNVVTRCIVGPGCEGVSVASAINKHARQSVWQQPFSISMPVVCVCVCAQGRLPVSLWHMLCNGISTHWQTLCKVNQIDPGHQDHLNFTQSAACGAMQHLLDRCQSPLISTQQVLHHRCHSMHHISCPGLAHQLL